MLRVPVVLWAEAPPALEMTSVFMFSGGDTVATGTAAGHVAYWNVRGTTLTPTNITLLGNLGAGAVTALTECNYDADRSFAKQFVGSPCAVLCGTEDGSLFKLDGRDGRCTLNARGLLPGKITCILVVKAAMCAIVCGHFPNIYVLGLQNLAIQAAVPTSRVQPHWVSAACLQRYEDAGGNACEALVTMGQSGTLSTFAIVPSTSSYTLDLTLMPERSVATACRHASHVSICQLVHSTMLVVCHDRFLLYTACDLQLLLAVPCPSSAGWCGGGFAGLGAVALFGNDGAACVFSFADNPAVMRHFDPQIPRLAPPHSLDQTTLAPLLPAPHATRRLEGPPVGDGAVAFALGPAGQVCMQYVDIWCE